MRIGARRCPCVVGRSGRDAFKAFFTHIVCHKIAEFRVAFDDFFRHVRFDGRFIRRQKKPCAVRALLMDVVDDLRMETVVNFINRQLRFDLRKSIPIAVVVVSDVLLVQPHE